MSSIDPSNNIDVHTNWALNTERNELYRAQFGEGERAAHQHAVTFVDKPLQLDQLKLLLGEFQQRRWAVFELPKGERRQIIFESGSYSLEKLHQNLEVVNKIDCTCNDKNEQTMRENEKKVLQIFCQEQIRLKEEYDRAKVRILELVQG